ncbi:MAG: alpha/beta hydrolase [Rhodothermales bacterium]|nr:alpha/beta hydrolase [Rhodothermales bacterium]
MDDVAPAYREAERRFWTAHVGEAPGEHYLTLATAGLRVRVLEHGAGPALLFLHGGPNAASTWAPLVGHLSGFRCLMPDRPGCGLSEAPDRPPRRVRPFVVQVLLDILDALDLEEACIVASSFGSYAALATAVEQPARIARMVHFGCPALVPGSRTPFRFVLQSLPGMRALLLKLEPPSDETTRKSFLRIGHAALLDEDAAPEGFLHWYTQLLRHTQTRENDLALFGQIRPRDALSREELRRLEIPTSFFWGAADSFGGVSVARSLTELIPGASLEMVDRGGHLPWIDDPRRAAQQVSTAMKT